jgi:hypothetical protein
MAKASGRDVSAPMQSQGADDWAWDDGLQWRGSAEATALAIGRF